GGSGRRGGWGGGGLPPAPMAVWRQSSVKLMARTPAVAARSAAVTSNVSTPYGWVTVYVPTLEGALGTVTRTRMRLKTSWSPSMMESVALPHTPSRAVNVSASPPVEGTAAGARM